jgi:glycosyltransferase involved in cell wall biosynthesis
MSRVHIFDGYKGAFVNFRAQLIADLIRGGHSVTVSAPDIDPEMALALSANGVCSRSIRLDRVGINPLRDLLGFLSIVRAIRHSRAEVVLAFSSKAIIYGTLASMLCGVRVRAAFVTGLGYTFVSSSGRGKVARFFQHSMYRIALRKATVVFFQNEDDVSAFKELGLVSEVTCIRLTNGSGVDLGQFQARPVTDPTVFLMVGRLLKGKGVLEYCRAAEMLAREAPQARFLLAGWADVDNPDSVDIEQFTRAMSDAGIHFLGRLGDVRPALAGCGVFVLPSYREGTPRSTLEALATGRAVVTTDAPGCRETVEDAWNGFIVPVADATALAAAMRKYIEHPALALEHGRRSRELAEAKFDVHAVNAGILQAIGLSHGAA